jgi:hypothetical protein
VPSSPTGTRNGWTSSAPALIARTLEKIARQYEAEALVLLCFEALAADCHRGQFASWLFDRTGELAFEIIPQ